MSSKTDRGSPSRFLTIALIGFWAAIGTPGPVSAQSEVEKSRARLEAIRQERELLRQEQERIQGQVRDADRELDNIDSQRGHTNRIVNELERQIVVFGAQLDSTALQLILAEDNLADRRAVLERRLVDIYKRGPLYLFQVLLSAESFADLLSRYKYLFLGSRQDRQLLDDVKRLHNQIRARRGELVSVGRQLEVNREEREVELRDYRRLAEERSSQLRRLRENNRLATRRLTELEESEEALEELLSDLEKTSTRNSSRPNSPETEPRTSSIDDLGTLGWPVKGTVIHKFGLDTLPNGGKVPRHGISIAAAEGTPVWAVSDGKVVMKGRLGTYGLSVIIEHESGYFSLYMQLGSTKVEKGESVTRGQTIGTVGGANTEDGPHLYFEIRGNNAIVLDPLEWLKKRQ